MKDIFSIIALLFALAFISCKKQYSCRCSTTMTTPATASTPKHSIVYHSDPKKIDQKLTQKQAKAVCAHESNNISATVANYEWFKPDYSDQFQTDCVLE